MKAEEDKGGCIYVVIVIEPFRLLTIIKIQKIKSHIKKKEPTKWREAVRSKLFKISQT